MAKSKPKARSLPKKKTAKKSTKVSTKKTAKKKPAKAASKKKNAKRVAKKAPKKVKRIISPTGGGGTLYVTYDLTKTPDVSMDSIYFNTTRVDLQLDRDTTDANKFKSKEPYPASTTNGDLLVRVTANGQVGGSWTMNISKNESPNSDNPIKENVNRRGRADHNATH